MPTMGGIRDEPHDAQVQDPPGDRHRVRSPLLHRGDTIIVISYGSYDPEDLQHYDPRVVHVTQDNEIRTIDNEVATLLGAPTA